MSSIPLQSQELGSLWLAISNLAEQCYMPHYGRLQEMGLLSKLDMIQVSYQTVAGLKTNYYRECNGCF